MAIPADGVICSHPARGAHTENFLQAMLRPQPPMSIARATRRHGEALFPLGKKAHFQEMVGCGDAVDPGQPHLLHQTVLQSFKEPLDTPLRLRTVRRDPFDPQFVQRSPKLRALGISPELFGKRLRTGRLKDAVFIGVMSQRTAIAPYPSLQGSQVLFRRVLLGEPPPEATAGIIDQSDQMASRTAILQPAERRAVLHHQLPETGSALAPHMHGLDTLAARSPQGRPGHPFPQRLPAHRETFLGQVFGGQRGAEIRVPLA